VVRTVGMVMIMIGFSIAFGYMMAIMRVPAIVTQFFLNISSDKYAFLLWVNVLLLLLGTFMDLAPMLLICTPISPSGDQTVRHRSGAFRDHHDPQSRHRPAHAAGGTDHGRGLRDRARGMEAVSRSILIFYVPMLVVPALVTYVPALSLWLPSMVLR
jgi:TRAP-type C4-dicarboxylate transport system permease large subunit